ncbi:MAG: ribosome recycling factor [Dehalococcoidia bacterium]
MEFEVETTKQFTSEKMQKSMQIFLDDLSSIRTGRASTKIIETIKVNVYGSTLPLNQLASINIIDSTLINVNAWDKNNVDSIVKSIQTSDLGINPAVDGEVIKLSIPPLSEERRQELSKIVKQKVEQSLVAIRNIRRTVIDQIKSAEKNSEISQDESKRMQQDVQTVTDLFVADMNKSGESKQTDILNI